MSEVPQNAGYGCGREADIGGMFKAIAAAEADAKSLHDTGRCHESEWSMLLLREVAISRKPGCSDVSGAGAFSERRHPMSTPESAGNGAGACCICKAPATRTVMTRGLYFTGQTLYCDEHAADLLARATRDLPPADGGTDA